MKLTKIHIHNFKCYDDLHITHLHPNMNILIGNNGTGKSSLLEALRISIGSLYLNFDKYDNKISVPGIAPDDIRLSRIGKNLEPSLPCYILTDAVVDVFDTELRGQSPMKSISWKRAVETKGGKTTHKDAKEMKQLSKDIQQSVRSGCGYDIPLIAFFSTNRYKKERRDSEVKTQGSRLQGYFNALDATTNIRFFLDLFYTETLDEIQNGNNSEILQTVCEAVKKCINCSSLRYELKQKELTVGYGNDTPLPFSMLSDGIRSTLALVMELAFRCYLLNPHRGTNAPEVTKGVVRIDELDLHLHPSWQTHILNDLRKAFPCIQFIVTTHAPLIFSQIGDCCIFSLSKRQIYDFPNQNGRDANYILQQMDVPNMQQDTQNALDRYIGMIDSGKGKSAEALHLRSQLEQTLGKDHAELQRADMLLTFF